MRINITVKDNISISDALTYVHAVVIQGKISNDGKNYCWATGFKDGVFVYARKTKAGNDSFLVYKEKGKGE